MTQDEKEQLQQIQGTGGFRVLQSLIQKKLDKLDSVREIKRDGLIEAQTLARQLCYEVLSEFLNEINLLPIGERETRKTYE